MSLLVYVHHPHRFICSSPRSSAIYLFELHYQCSSVQFSPSAAQPLILNILLFGCSNAVEKPCAFITLWQCIVIFFQSFTSDTLFLPLLLYSLRVNLDMGKIVYSWVIRRDSKIPGTVVRSSTIPEQLGRISYLLTDKTGICVENTALSHGMLLLFGFWRMLLNPRLKVNVKSTFRVRFYSWMKVA